MESSQIQLSINKEQLKELPAVRFPGSITVVETSEQENEAFDNLSKHEVVGFDTETKPSFKKGKVNNVSLIQVATSNHCYLFRINKLGFSEGMKNFMENNSIIKIGLSLKDDFTVLHRSCPFTPAGFIDLQQFVKQFSITDLSLSKIYGIIFGQRISKSQRLSNWEAPSLTEGQQLYASLDAWACLHIYKRLKSGEFIPQESQYLVVPEEQTNAEEQSL